MVSHPTSADTLDTHDARPSPAEDAEQPSFEAPIPPYLFAAIYTDSDLAAEHLNEFASAQGFSISTRTSKKNIRYLGCLRGRPPHHRAGKQARRDCSYTSYTKCPYSLKVIRIGDGDEAKFAIREVNVQHNHAPFPEGLDAEMRWRSRNGKRARIDHKADREEHSRRRDAIEAPSVGGSSSRSQLGALIARGDREAEEDNESVATLGPPPPSTAFSRLSLEPPPVPAQSTASIAGAATSMVQSNISTRTDASAIRALLSLSYRAQQPPASTTATPPIPRQSSSTDRAAAVDSERRAAKSSTSSSNTTRTTVATAPTSPAPPTSSAPFIPDASVVSGDFEDELFALILRHLPYHQAMAQISSIDAQHAQRLEEWAHYVGELAKLRRMSHARAPR